MYIEKIHYDNLGPIRKFDFSFTNAGNPKPLILVGENGSGKSLFLSNIVDAFFEIAQIGYQNVAIPELNGYKYFKTLSNIQISIGEAFLCSHIRFAQDEDKIEYIFKCGSKAFDSYCSEIGDSLHLDLQWPDTENFKKVITNKKIAKDCFTKGVICYFGPSRYEKPVWVGKDYYLQSLDEHINITEKFDGTLETPIIASNITPQNMTWLLDIIVDSRTDVAFQGQEMASVNVSPGVLSQLTQARRNVESILSDILGEQVYFGLNFRNSGNSRFHIRSKATGNVVIPTLDSLSTGQLSLFNMFSTIIRYADKSDISYSVKNENISGIVVVDEIELHLHSNLQRNILPKLLKRFPKIQFIITSHSPLFLLGMEEKYNADGFDIYQLPDGTKIAAEMFSEFQNAYEYISNTKKYNEEISSAINKHSDKSLIITEGASDWRHLKAAFNSLKQCEDYTHLFEGIDFDLLEYDPKNSNSEHVLKLEMGGASLSTMCETCSKLPQKRKLIFIADNDDASIAKKLSASNSSDTFKCWGNGVYSCLLPVPAHRKDTPEICIEHLYSDDEIKTPVNVDGIERRLFFGSEFDKYGKSPSQDRFCQNRNACGPNKICIIEGAMNERVLALNDETDSETNYALPKMVFASKVLANEAPFNSFNFSGFLPLFETIRKILISQ